MQRLPRVVCVLFCLLALPAIASAQATVSGTVRDSSGAVLPGVTVEASSPALIEKVRTAASDGSGQYRITDLPPGEYTLTFSLSGFNTVKRQGINVSGTGVVPISIELAVGTLTETLTVTGEAPLVDTQTTRRETVISADTIASLPITRNYGGVLYATPGLVVQPGVNANDLMPSMALFSAHGGQSTEGRVFVNGVSVNGPFGSNSVTQFAFDTANAEEMQVLVSGGLGEAETGGPVANIVPRSGGNKFSGNAFYSGTGSKLQADNLDDELKQLGIAKAPTVRNNWDTNFALGGPIKRDRLWFYGNIRSVGVAQVVSAGVLPNKYTGDASQWLYAPITTSNDYEVRQVESKRDMSGRLTSQLTRRNRVTFSYTFQSRCQGSSLTAEGDGCRQPGDNWIGAPANAETTAPEAGSGYMAQPTTLTQATYTSPISSRHLIDAALSRFAYGQIGNGSVPPDSTNGLIGVTERSNRYGRANTSYRAPFGWGVYDAVPWNWRASWAYVTGAHSAKLGYQGSLLKYDWTTYTNPALMRYTVDSTVTSCVAAAITCPVGVTYATSSYFEYANRAETHAIFIQDQWTKGRLSLQGALRYDTVTSWMPAFHNGTDETSRFSPTPVRFEKTDSVTGYHDITPRMGAAYDLFGNGRTAIKVNAGKYLAAAVADGIYSSMSPALNYVRTISGTRGWTDNNGNFAVDCDLLSPASQSPATGAIDTCSPLTGGNLNFGSVVPNTIVNPDVLSGWGVRNYNWNFGVSAQHAIVPRVSAEVQYNRRWWGNYLATINQLVGPSDYQTWTLPIPTNDKLPGGGGGTAQYVAITSEASARGSLSYQTRETDFADARTAYWHGVDVNVTARVADRLNLQMGTSTGRGVRNTCDLWQARPELQGNNRADACAVTEPWLTSFRGLASYRVPKIDVQVSGTMRSTRTTAGGDNASNGSSLSGNYQLPNSEVVKYLGRLPAGAQATGTTTVNIVVPSALYPSERRNQIDVRFAKILRLGDRRLDVGADIYNLLNANTATSFDQTYLFSNNGATYLNPTAIMAPLLVRFNATLTF
jgi:hypothetical protein